MKNITRCRDNETAKSRKTKVGMIGVCTLNSYTVISTLISHFLLFCYANALFFSFISYNLSFQDQWPAVVWLVIVFHWYHILPSGYDSLWIITQLVFWQVFWSALYLKVLLILTELEEGGCTSLWRVLAMLRCNGGLNATACKYTWLHFLVHFLCTVTLSITSCLWGTWVAWQQ